MIFFTVFGLSGCATSQNTSPLAPSPPELRFSSLYYEEQSAEAANYMFEPKQEQKPLVAKDILMAASVAGIEAASQPQNFEKKKDKEKRCRFKDRFDRKAVLAYEWGDNSKNRLALDVDGLNLSDSEDRAFKIEYRLRLQPEKTRTEKCRYSSSWQGLIGSGYNEFFVRENDTIYEEFKAYRTKIKTYMDGVLE